MSRPGTQWLFEVSADYVPSAARLRGHTDYRMTERYYIAMRSLAAGERFADALASDLEDPEVRRHLSYGSR